MTEIGKGNQSGYKKPPKHSQFPKGTSGNPGGRPKGAKNVRRLIYDFAGDLITISTHNGKLEVSVREAIAKKVLEMALKGDYRFFQTFMALDLEMEKLDLSEERQRRSAALEAIQGQIQVIMEEHLKIEKGKLKRVLKDQKAEKKTNSAHAEHICGDDDD